MPTDSAPIVRSIDLGYGYVKYTTRNRQSATPDIVQCCMPSMAVPGAVNTELGAVGGLRLPKTIAVNVREMLYQVGPDAHLLLAGQTGRTLSADYSRSPAYEALMLGTIAYIGEPVIDYLVLGLPVSRYREERDRLKSLYTGSLKVPLPTELDRTQRVEVRNVAVVPQPIGGFLAAKMDAEDAGKGWRGATLVIDPGYFTFDWVVVSESNTYVPTRSGAVHGGMSSIIRAIADQIERESGLHINNTHSIDQAIRSGESIHMGQFEYKPEAYKGIIESRALAYIADMVGRLGESNDIRRVVLCGGGAKLISKVVKDAMPTWSVVLAKDPAYANVRGFQQMGESVARQAVAA